MEAKWWLICFSATSVVAAIYATSMSWNGRYLLTRSPGVIREALAASKQLNQNYVFPGCGVGREDAGRAYQFVSSVSKSNRSVLRPLLRDPDPQVRAGAALTLGELRDEVSLQGILTLMQSDPSERVRADAAGALEYMNIDPILPALIRLTGASNDRLTRACAFLALSNSEQVIDTSKVQELCDLESASGSDIFAARVAQRALWELSKRTAPAK